MVTSINRIEFLTIAIWFCWLRSRCHSWTRRGRKYSATHCVSILPHRRRRFNVGVPPRRASIGALLPRSFHFAETYDDYNILQFEIAMRILMIFVWQMEQIRRWKTKKAKLRSITCRILNIYRHYYIGKHLERPQRGWLKNEVIYLYVLRIFCFRPVACTLC